MAITSVEKEGAVSAPIVVGLLGLPRLKAGVGRTRDLVSRRVQRALAEPTDRMRVVLPEAADQRASRMK